MPCSFAKLYEYYDDYDAYALSLPDDQAHFDELIVRPKAMEFHFPNIVKDAWESAYVKLIKTGREVSGRGGGKNNLGGRE